ncbi:DUF4180 domain-containing protein [Caulobacter sp. UNC279MFTsu5.1]|uniref:DUF4180 domain-containing protein n=1 Tax=Caulobacter sp. UNC279MFTsu5.1 TaxID=1502775 RepID=UPI0008F168B2|nr:DUF4180 domain-containing protein [Caulobacter sp. UNC279MFTsu5.1]SFJ03970.1 protein of unknown function [Caulobacter sp. UNC279MFTsu5.1]
MTHLETLHDTPVLVFEAEGPKLDEHSVNDVLSEAWSADATWLAIPLERLAPGFLDLKTRMAGEVIQKFTNYRVGVAFVGDVTPWTGASTSLRDFVRESNRGRAVWFVLDRAEFEARLADTCASAT